MREIKFRGKRLDNEKWAYGYLFKIWEQAYILWGTTNSVPNMIEVDPKTVGQYLNRKDRHGNALYEGDIIEHKVGYSAYGEDTDFEDKTVTWIGILSLRMSAGVVLTGKCRIESDIDCSVLYEGNGSKRLSNIEKYATSLGNKFDNPELLNP